MACTRRSSEHVKNANCNLAIGCAYSEACTEIGSTLKLLQRRFCGFLNERVLAERLLKAIEQFGAVFWTQMRQALGWTHADLNGHESS